ncbi:hypothetical protein DFH09DRAFT_1080119 [Mycena vulgaris]|nr:hypothetical protein DFH09DRAFT_1080119 [Mycena vulgaris]
MSSDFGKIRAATRCRDGNGRRFDGRFSSSRNLDGTAVAAVSMVLQCHEFDSHMPTVIFSCFQLEKSTQTLRLQVDLYDPLKRPSRPSFDGPLLEEKNGRRDGHGTRSTGAVEPSRRQRAAALGKILSSLSNLQPNPSHRVNVQLAVTCPGVMSNGINQANNLNNASNSDLGSQYPGALLLVPFVQGDLDRI